MYNYKEAIKQDVKEWVEDHHSEIFDCKNDFSSEAAYENYVYEYIYDGCFVADSVTGNASGSYTFSRYQARENFFNDPDSDDYIDGLVGDGFADEKRIGCLVRESDWEQIDVLIRCWLLNVIVCEVVDEII